MLKYYVSKTSKEDFHIYVYILFVLPFILFYKYLGSLTIGII
jgi:hypothetical protein